MGVFLCAGYVFQTLGLEHTSASNAGFITGLMVVFTPVLGAVFLGQRLPAVAWVAAAVSAAGLYLLSGAGGGLELRGDGLVLLCAIAFAAHILVTDRAVGDHDVGRAAGGAAQRGRAGVPGRGRRPPGSSRSRAGSTVWSALLVTSLVASALGFFVQTYAQRNAPPARTALILASEPAFAGLFGYLLADERLGAVSWLGAAHDPGRDRGRGGGAAAAPAAAAARGLALPAPAQPRARLARQLLHHQVVAVLDHVHQQLPVHAVHDHGVPVALVQVVAGADGLVGVAQLLGQAGIALQRDPAARRRPGR